MFGTDNNYLIAEGELEGDEEEEQEQEEDKPVINEGTNPFNYNNY